MPTDEELVKGNLTVKIPGAEKEINLDGVSWIFDCRNNYHQENK